MWILLITLNLTLHTKNMTWIIAIIVYALFLLWYIGWRRPLKPQEIEAYMGKLENFGNAEPERLTEVRKFLERDDGKQFFMMNLIELKEKPDPVEGVPDDLSSATMLRRYTNGWFSRALFSRAGWFAFISRPKAGPIEMWGAEPAARWSAFGIVRYRSRRDMMEILSRPEFHEGHRYKLAAIESTIAYPTTGLLMLAPPLVIGLAIALCAALLNIFFP